LKHCNGSWDRVFLSKDEWEGMRESDTTIREEAKRGERVKR
jgi:hypothetical protein